MTRMVDAIPLPLGEATLLLPIFQLTYVVLGGKIPSLEHASFQLLVVSE